MYNTWRLYVLSLAGACSIILQGCATQQVVPVFESAQARAGLADVCEKVLMRCRQEASLVAQQAKNQNVATQQAQVSAGAMVGAGSGAIAGVATGHTTTRYGYCRAYHPYHRRYYLVPCGQRSYDNRATRGVVGAGIGALMGAGIGLATSQASMQDLQLVFDSSLQACVASHRFECKVVAKKRR